MPSINEEIGERIREVRESRGKSIYWLAEAIGKSKSTVARIEAGEQEQTVATLQAIAVALDCSLFAFLTRWVKE